ncbi:hypothetical protein [Nocardioides donggukensis]|uniref:Lipoprotein n=1 Tax=Nocardioides donggukensis TaxID=2774019 RepID=A0A927K422_9ACTN|nr:hypothetical protein [Nocardioides donggukensis]MBD8868640.1 hypothetical protein [Nocardioides donggukensis]
MRSRVPAVLLAGILGLAATGCGSAPPEIDPTGIDELVIPTPDPAAADFVAEVDNPLLPLPPGETRRYRDDAGDRVLRVKVLTEVREVAGVATTVVRSVEGRGAARRTSERSYAQDRDGNVWLFAVTDPAEGSWQAGVAGAEAGLAMPAEPRVGDGWARAVVPGAGDEYVTVLEVDDTRSTPYADYDGVVVLEESSPDQPTVTRAAYAPGAGLVERDGSGGTWTLVAQDRPGDSRSG